jgi:hypothetical protein
MRMAADCRQLAGNAPGIALQEHFRLMAEFWTALSAGDLFRSEGSPENLWLM